MTAAEALALKICPSCHSMQIDCRPDFISCRCCGIHGDPNSLVWCEKVPIYRMVKREDLWIEKGQLYKYHERWFVLAGWAPGCGRLMEGDRCRSCRDFYPEPTERPKGKKKVVKDGKAAAAGEEVVV